VRSVQILTLNTQALLAEKCHVAESFWNRFKGLMGRAQFDAGEGLLFPRCNNVHMWFMRIPIDLVFLRDAQSEDGRKCFEVTSVRVRVRPWSIFPFWDQSAHHTLELPAGTLERQRLTPGDLLCSS
jgi:uncharacterized membrane protein (UPF0127 family)